MRRYLIDSIENMRDIGGYPVNTGYIKYGRIIRSNLPDKIKSKDVEKLRQMGIESVIDLRTEEELRNKPSVFEKSKGFNVHHIEMIGGREIPDSCEGVPISYLNMLEGKENIKRIFDIIAEEEKGIIYFCNAGKDRTGVITSLILMTLGVDKKDIIADYILTGIYMKDMLDNYIKASNNDRIKEIIFPKIDYMERFLDEFEYKYNSIENYLNEIGIDNEKILKIRHKYIN